MTLSEGAAGDIDEAQERQTVASPRIARVEITTALAATHG
jgi:hypothetical protein